VADKISRHKYKCPVCGNKEKFLDISSKPTIKACWFCKEKDNKIQEMVRISK